MTENFKLWLKHLRSDLRICMLVPMEAVMGLPVEIAPGKAYLIPFFRSDTALRACYPPSAYVCVSYPDAQILRFQDLIHDYRENVSDMPRCEIRLAPKESDSFDYYNYLEERIRGLSASDHDPDAVLRECVTDYCEGMLDIYLMLIREKNKYLERNRNE